MLHVREYCRVQEHIAKRRAHPRRGQRDERVGENRELSYRIIRAGVRVNKGRTDINLYDLFVLPLR